MISHWTAARIWGGVVPDNDWTHVSFMRDVRFRVRGVKHHRFRHRLDIRKWQGLPVTSPGQTFCHLARHLGLVDLVALGDRLVKKGRCTPSDLVVLRRRLARVSVERRRCRLPDSSGSGSTRCPRQRSVC